MATKLGLKTTA